jgi:hypothetical protein
LCGNIALLAGPARVGSSPGAARSRILVVAIDSNRDGRSDVQEYYDLDGGLLRRDSDRNFNGQVDLVEEFDATTHEQQRSIADTDDDGSADLLVLFEAGRAVFAERTSQRLNAGTTSPGDDVWPRSAGKPTGGTLRPLTDPFQLDTAVGGNLPQGDGSDRLAVASSEGLPLSPIAIVIPHVTSLGRRMIDGHRAESTTVAGPSLRGPPFLS